MLFGMSCFDGFDGFDGFDVVSTDDQSVENVTRFQCR